MVAEAMDQNIIALHATDLMLNHERMKLKGEGKELFEGCDTRQTAHRGILLHVRKPGVPYPVNDLHVTAYPRPLRREDLIDVSGPVLRRGNAVLAHKGSRCSKVLDLLVLG